MLCSTVAQPTQMTPVRVGLIQSSYGTRSRSAAAGARATAEKYRVAAQATANKRSARSVPAIERTALAMTKYPSVTLECKSDPQPKSRRVFASIAEALKVLMPQRQSSVMPSRSYQSLKSFGSLSDTDGMKCRYEPSVAGLSFSSASTCDPTECMSDIGLGSSFRSIYSSGSARTDNLSTSFEDDHDVEVEDEEEEPSKSEIDAVLQNAKMDTNLSADIGEVDVLPATKEDKVLDAKMPSIYARGCEGECPAECIVLTVRDVVSNKKYETYTDWLAEYDHVDWDMRIQRFEDKKRRDERCFLFFCF
mmetsp:Transcript_95030/g.165887  ORF Transcript_95030/g.165887 Transcript_95030/m.165887 type:complete len:306 (+) Transcript_95030:48-965(+)